MELVRPLGEVEEVAKIEFVLKQPQHGTKQDHREGVPLKIRIRTEGAHITQTFACGTQEPRVLEVVLKVAAQRRNVLDKDPRDHLRGPRFHTLVDVGQDLAVAAKHL